MKMLFRWASLAGAVILAALVFLPGCTEAARHVRNHELNYFQTSNVKVDGRDALRIEIGMDNDKLEYETSVKPYAEKQLIVDLQNTKPGELRKTISLKSKLATKVRIAELQRNHTQIRIDFSNPAVKENYRIYTLERDRKAKKPYRLVIDVLDNGAAGGKVTGIAGRTIVLDAGHGGTDSGAVGPTGVMEKNVTLAVTKKVESILKNSGARVVMTRTRDVDVYGPNDTARQELQARCNVSNFDPSSELFVSIHCNSFSSQEAKGMETYYYASSSRGKRLATLLNEELEKAGGLLNRGVKTANFYVIKHTNVPASLIELGFISNYREERLLNTDSYQQKLAGAVARAIARFFN
ncbi:N-acetylmuramoyl-L-alanine amidase [Selenomonas sp.]|uniref:N-acetylmuramoyl-L-alanine amidase family protein n=1 Tax=Selenomonas sp. TaxID=2053611 RepID=UPI0025CF7212|nr:N-acetylmuramoyl-L-alanine amidase [Selenomonas sp.]MBQ1867875.1 N-acetylmuramoyl-L-alanine amidase [Selenomonas sp.]